MDTLIDARYVPTGESGSWAAEALDRFTTAIAESFGLDPASIEQVAVTTATYQNGLCAGTLGFAVPGKGTMLANIGVYDEPSLPKSERRARVLIPAALP